MVRLKACSLGMFGLAGAALASVGVSAPMRPKPGLQDGLQLNGIHNITNERVSGEFIVTLRDEGAVRSNKALALRAAAARFESLGLSVIKTFRASPSMLVKVVDNEGSEGFTAVMEALKADPGVASIEANVILRTLAVPNDDRFGEQYALENRGQTGGQSGADIGAVQAWNMTTGSRKVVVGVIDTGIDGNHPDLAENMWKNPGEVGLDASGRDKETNGIDDDGNGYADDVRGWDFVNNDRDPTDDQGHGTHTAGTIGAVGNNRAGVTGVNWQVSLVGIKFLGADGSGTLDDAVEAIEYSTRLGVNLTSNSWGGGGFSAAMAAAIREAGDKGILFVAAAGNEANDNDTSPSYPATYPFDNVISVAATNHSDTLAYFSNFGAQSVHIAAPGVDVLSTTPGGKYEELSGTSMACPHVSGAAALVWAAFPGLDYKLVKTRLLNNVSALPALKTRTVSGGRLSLPAALERDDRAPSRPGKAQVLSQGLFTADLNWSFAGDDDTAGRAASYEVRFIQESDPTKVPDSGSWNQSALLGVARDLPGQPSIPFVIAQVADDFQGFVATRAVDNVGNAGAFSEPSYVRLADRVVVSSVDADAPGGVVFEGDWGVQNVEGRGLVFSDSPDGEYEQGIDASLIMAPVAVDLSKETYLTFFMQQELEPRFDFATVEYRRAGDASWTELAKYTGSQTWRKEILKLPKGGATGGELQLRFRLKTDRSVSFEGWLLDGISVIQVP